MPGFSAVLASMLGGVGVHGHAANRVPGEVLAGLTFTVVSMVSVLVLRHPAPLACPLAIQKMQ